MIKDHKWRIAQLMSQDSTIDLIFEEIIGELPEVAGGTEPTFGDYVKAGIYVASWGLIDLF